MTTQYAREYYKHYYKNNKETYRLYRQSRYDSTLKKYYQNYYLKNKNKIKNQTYENKNKIKKSTPFEKITKNILVTFD
jgi:hypothetical protein